MKDLHGPCTPPPPPPAESRIVYLNPVIADFYCTSVYMKTNIAILKTLATNVLIYPLQPKDSATERQTTQQRQSDAFQNSRGVWWQLFPKNGTPIYKICRSSTSVSYDSLNIGVA